METTDSSKLFQIFGTDELVKLFEEMDRDNQTNILNQSFREASKLIISEAQSNLRGNYKHVSNSLGVIMRKNIQTLEVGAMKNRGGNLAHIANAGTKERSYKTKNGNTHRTGRIIGSYFWDNAVETTGSDVEETIFKDIKDRFNKLIQKNNKIK
jgi:hypothetical protein